MLNRKALTVRYFTADTHFEHPGVIKMMARVDPQSALMRSSEQHDALLIDNINSLVGRDDELIIIGDFAGDNPGKYRSKIHCKHVRLIMGNHDRPKKSMNVFGECPTMAWTKCYSENKKDHLKLHLSHYPMAYWDGSHRGEGHLYGHVHGQRESYLDEIEPQRKAMDVGVDNAFALLGSYRPFSEAEVFSYMARRSGHDDVRYYHDYQQNLYVKRGLYNEI